MHSSLPQYVADQLVEELAHFDQAPSAFFQAWKRGVALAGTRWFGAGTQAGWEQATSKWDLCPNVLSIDDALGVLSPSERMFLSAMVSVYDTRDGGKMLKHAGFKGLADFSGLDLPRRKVIADLILNYNGW
ncbi:hypothetical protein [Xanthomonas hortorum]|uniref:Uncharacterized protein n=1 Tax=Xanthomonas hortorum TaxID=56454 RepID=A0AA47EW35_9XANT|nr:hypothetical protein [Xanthomonas hortorum]WAH66461.1 hypothetical protein OEG85_11325 [Xanthomonas hortorum]